MISILICYFLIFSYSGSAQQPWNEVKKSGECKAYTRSTKDGKFKEYRSTAVIHAPLDAAVAVYCEVMKHPQWMKDIAGVNKFKTLSEKEWYIQYKVDMPWPMEDRDAVYHIRLLQQESDKSVKVFFDSEPDALPAQPGYIRISKSSGYWKFSNQSDGTIMAETIGVTDPAGVPAWIVNMFISDGPLQTILNFKKLAESDTYKNKKVSFLIH